jgi:hypothetical protein
MKFILFFCAAIFLLVISCSKNSYTTKPQISIESITTTVAHNGQLQAKLKFTDKQGDLGQGTFTAYRVRLNTFPITPDDSVATNYAEPIPDFPDKSLGEFQFNLDAGQMQEHTTVNDTLQLKFFVTDRGGNTSDTITSPVIVVLYQ